MKVNITFGQDILAGIKVTFVSASVKTFSHIYEYRHFIDTSSYLVVDGKRPGVLVEQELKNRSKHLRRLFDSTMIMRNYFFSLLHDKIDGKETEWNLREIEKLLQQEFERKEL